MTAKPSFLRPLLGVTLLLACSAAPAMAQDEGNFARDNNTSVRERARPGLEASGIRAGAFLVYPRATVEAVTTDNVYASESNAVSDWAVRATPEIVARSNWSRHELAILARAAFLRYGERSAENAETYSLGANGRLDAARGTTIVGSATTTRLTEPRTAPTAPTAAREPIVYYSTDLSLAPSHEFNRLRLGGRFTYTKLNYENSRTTAGAVLIQDSRDRTETTQEGRAEFAISGDTSVYLSASVNQREYELQPPRVGRVRDSSGSNVSIGTSFDITQLIRGEAQVGRTTQSYDQAGTPDAEFMSFRGAVDWLPTPLTTVSLSGSRSIEEATENNTPGFISTNFGVQVDHELLRQLLLTARAATGDDDYEQANRSDKRTSAGFSATYLMNQNVGLRAGYDHLKLESSGSARRPNYKENRFMISFTVQY